MVRSIFFFFLTTFFRERELRNAVAWVVYLRRYR